MSVSWLCNGKPLTNDHAFVSTGVSNVLQIKDVQTADEATYTCMVSANNGTASSSAKLTVLGKLWVQLEMGVVKFYTCRLQYSGINSGG